MLTIKFVVSCCRNEVRGEIMKVINIASGNSTWRGLDYYKMKKVLSYNKVDEFRYEGKVKGSSNTTYNVLLDIEHPRKSKCDCPHAKDKRIVCKHMVALYFTIFPDEVEVFLKEVEEAQKEYEEYESNRYNKTINHIRTMSKSELEEAIIEILNVAPEWVYDKFVRDYVGL